MSNVKVPLDYRRPLDAERAGGLRHGTGGWTWLRAFLGLVCGFPAGVTLMIGIGSLLPGTSRADTGRQAEYAFFTALAIAVAALGAGIASRRWFWCALVIGAGLGAAAMAFFIGLLSSITC
jgi:hypothetical protein